MRRAKKHIVASWFDFVGGASGSIPVDVPVTLATAPASNSDTANLWLAGSGSTTIEWVSGTTTNVTLTSTPTKYSNTYSSETPLIKLSNASNVDFLATDFTSNFTITTSNINGFSGLSEFVALGDENINGDVTSINISGLTDLSLGDQNGNSSLTGDIGILIKNHSFLNINIVGGDLSYTTQTYTVSNIPNLMNVVLDNNILSNSEIDQIIIDFDSANAGSGLLHITGEQSGYTTVASTTAASNLTTDSWDLLFNGQPLTNISATNTGQTITEGETITPIVISITPNPDLVDYVINGSLPAGLTFDEPTKTISGTPNLGESGDYQYVIRARAYGATYTGLIDLELDFTVAQAPLTLEFSPESGATNIPVDQVITITFNQAIRNTDASEITDANVDSLITLVGSVSGALAFDATIDVAKEVITITPSSDLPNDEDVTVTIASVEDSLGNETAGGESSTFSVISASTVQILVNMTRVTTVSNVDDPSGRYWNNCLNSSSGTKVADLVDIANAATGIGLSFTDAFTGDFNGLGRSPNDGVYPNGAWATGISFDSAKNMQLSGLSENDSVVIEFGSSYNAASGDRISQFTVGAEDPVSLDNELNPPQTVISDASIIDATGNLNIECDILGATASVISFMKITIN